MTAPLLVHGLMGSLLLAFPALFSIVNPIGSALIFNEVTTGRSRAERHAIAAKVALYSAAILLISLWAGSYILSFFGISIAALRIAGGLVVASTGWRLLMHSEASEQHEATSAAPAKAVEDDIAFFPLTMPLTTGPGTIAVAIALSSQRPDSDDGRLAFFAGLSLTALAIALVVWLFYRWSDRLTETLGPSGVRIASRLVAFLLLCIGVQIIVTGVAGVNALIRGG